MAYGHFGKWHVGNGSGTAVLPTSFGIGTSRTFNSNDPCPAAGSWVNTSVAVLDRGMQFIRSAKAAGKPFYVNIVPHVRHRKRAHSCVRRGKQDADAQVGRLHACSASWTRIHAAAVCDG